MSLDNARAVIIVFALRGCPACEEYKPRLEAEVRRWQHNGAPIVFSDAPEPGQVAVLLLDSNSADPNIQGLADRHQIVALPTTLLFLRGRAPETIEGALDSTQIYELLRRATGV